MIIEQSNIGFASRHLSLESYLKTESLKAWVGDKRPNFEGKPAATGGATDNVQLSGQTPAAPSTASAQKAQDAGDDSNLDPRYLLLKLLIERLLHVKITLFDPQTLNAQQAPQASPDAGQAPDAAASQPQKAGYGVEYDLSESRHEQESTSFAASGVVQTADGRQIDFNLTLNMSREYASQSSVSVRAGDAVVKDPLVINFSGSAASLSSARFAFDIDGDGKSEQVAALGANSAFLALDKNGDGKINDGSELFGTKTGNGFGELAAYDADHNGWIDENDAVFNNLKTWSGGADGNGTLETLKQAGVGAIYLGSQQTPFSLKNADNALLGQVKSSGVFLAENGSAGTVQQVDLAV
jgi:hypothetical protein